MILIGGGEREMVVDFSVNAILVTRSQGSQGIKESSPELVTACLGKYPSPSSSNLSRDSAYTQAGYQDFCLTWGPHEFRLVLKPKI